ncbi:hypothetical protein FRB95_004969 [Tulasnella sp. JGI-2019a]|nr:hypothetical protein FRB95_004969 [Tulasnella sp. JGI-2019a]
MIAMRSFGNALRIFSDGLHRLYCTEARHHNTLLPISRLPNDLLVEIFAIASMAYNPTKNMLRSRYSTSDRRAVNTLVTLLFVCHEWREIIQNEPSLWAYMSSDHPHGANLKCLARSNQAPLHISFDCFDLDTAFHQEFKAKIFQEVHRWKSVEISGVTMEVLKELELQPAPLLEKLHVRGFTEPAQEALSIFCGSANELRHLTILGIRICWESNILSGLKTLYIETSQADGPSARQVMHVLQSCPDLIIFNLDLQKTSNPGPIPLEASTIELPRLEYLRLRIHPLVTKHLLQRIRIPLCKTFDVDFADTPGHTPSPAVVHLVPILSSILLATRMVKIDMEFRTLMHRAMAKIDEEGKEGDELAQRICIQALCDRFTDGFVLKTLSGMLDNVQTPPFPPPVFLRISRMTSSHDVTFTMNMFSSFITKLDIELNAETVKTIISYLAEPVKDVVDGTTTLRWPLPNLMDLSFQWYDGRGGLELKLILGCIQRRAGRGMSSEGRHEHHEELPARLIKLQLPRGSSTGGLARMFPDYKEWCGGVEPELE